MSQSQYHAFIVDDEAEARHSLAYLLKKQGWKITELSNAKDALSKLSQQKPDLVISDIRMPGMSGLDMFDELKHQPNQPPFIFISAHADIAMAVEALQQGAFSFFEKPYDPKQLSSTAGHAAQQHRLAQENQLLNQQIASLSGLEQILIGNNPALAKVRQLIPQFAKLNLPVMILGATGTGKELAAKAIHSLSKRANSPFITVNCATLTDEQFGQAMFGSQVQAGYVDKAAGGTIFLDELTAFSHEQQAQLLRLIETGEYQRTDSIETWVADIRIISATNQTIAPMLENSTLRDDLIFRLNNLSLVMPPLKDSGEDITLLFNHYLQQYCQINDLPIPSISMADVAELLTHAWPGNVRELRHLSERFAVHNLVQAYTIAEALHGDHTQTAGPQYLRHAVAEFERAVIRKTIIEHHGKMDDVAEHLGIGRRTLNEKLVKLGLDRKQLI